MSQPLPEIVVPDATSRFNDPAGAGFVRWFASLKASIGVALLEVEARTSGVVSRLAVSKTDAGAPVTDAGTQYMEVSVDSGQRIISAVELDGTNYLPQLRTDRLDGGDYVEYTVQDARFKELVLDSENRILSYVAADGSTPAGSGGGGGGLPAPVKPWDVIISAGQSNSWITDYAAFDGIDADARVYQWDDSGNITLTPPGSQDHIGWATARHWAQRHMSPDRLAVWARAGVGSTGFSSTSLSPAPAGYSTFPGGTWDRTLTADPINLALTLLQRIRDIKAKMPPGSRIFLLWSQGENDRGKVQSDGISWYTSRFDDLVAQARLAADDPNMPVLVTDMTAPTIVGNEAGRLMNDAQEDAPRRLQRTAFVPGPVDFGFRDSDIHWTSQGHGERGRRLAEAVAWAKANTANTRPAPPRNVKIVRHGTAVLVSWAPPVTRYTALQCELSTDGGATWAPMTMRHPLALTATATAPTGQAIIIRVNSTNETATSSWQEWKA